MRKPVLAVVFGVTDDGKKVCPECGKIFDKYGAQTHWRLVHRGDKHRTGGGWNKGLTKAESASLCSAGAKLSRIAKERAAAMTLDERKRRFGGPKKFSPLTGGLRRGAGRGRGGWYEGVWCDSTWELAWVIFQIDARIQFERNTQAFYYEFDGKKCRFFPDFRLADNSLVEIKGWLDQRNLAKIASVDGLLVIGKQDIQPYLDHARQKYGNDFATVAYGIAPDRRKHRCTDCGAAVQKRSSRCKRCAGIKMTTQKIVWPNCEELRVMIAASNWESVAHVLGVSSNAVRKHLRIYERIGQLDEMEESPV